MPFAWIAVDDGVLRLRLSGVLTRLEMDHMQTAIREAIQRYGAIKILVLLDDFGGWQSGVDWGDLSFAHETDASIEKIAVVGDGEWKEEVLSFMVAPLRTTAIEYFERADIDAANRWIS